MKKIEPVDLICPTYNNPIILSQCINSILSLHLGYPVRIFIVNNGHTNSLSRIGSHPLVRIIQSGGKNLGWEGGLKLGLEHSKSEFVGFINDDIFVPTASKDWLRMLMSSFMDPAVGAVGPSSNCVMGTQNIWKLLPHVSVETPYLIGFCMFLRRKALDEAGGVDDGLPGGDDLDLSIRLRDKGYKLICRKDVFVYHHGFVTGSALYGSANKPGGWNSKEMTEKTDTALIQKHGFKKWFQCRMGFEYPGLKKGIDYEGDIIRKHIVGDKIADLGCANNKTVPHAIGVDMVVKGERIPTLNATSEADIQADIEQKMPFEPGSLDCVIARHILEHTLDPIATLKLWGESLKEGGRLIIAVPDEDLFATIGLNPEHLHAFNAKSLKTLAEACGYTAIAIEKSASASIVIVLEKASVLVVA